MEEIVPYDIHAEDGCTYRLHVRRGDVNRLDNDHVHKFRCLQRLLNAGTEPVGKWSNGSKASDEGPSASTGAIRKSRNVWPGKTSDILLALCKPHRKELRRRNIPDNVLEDIRQSLSSMELQYSCDQIKAKLKGLKRMLDECKLGKHAGPKYKHFALLSFIYDEPVAPETGDTVEDDDWEDEGLDGRSFSVGEAVNTDQATGVDGGGIGVVVGNVDEAAGIDEGRLVVAEGKVDEAAGFDGDLLDTSFSDLGIVDENGNAVRAVVVPQTVQTQTTPSVNVDDLRSPHRKRSRTGARTPRTPPKAAGRKTPKSQLEWPPERTTKFMELCVGMKADLQGDHIPLRVWLALNKAMHENGHPTVTAQQCKDKFTVMYTFFSTSLIKSGGYVAGQKWAQYASFCEIHDLPADYQLQEDVGQEEYDDDEDSDPYKNRVLLLLNLYEEKKHLFDRTKSSLRHISIFNMIATEMRAFEVAMSGKQCKELMGRLLMKYRSEFDANQRTGSGGVTWPFFDRMRDIFGLTSTLVAPVCLSVGLQDSYRVGGVPQATVPRSTRTRPPASLPVSKAVKASAGNPSSNTSRKGTFKDWYRNFQEQQVQEKKTVAEELALTRQVYERNSKVRTALFQKMFAKLFPDDDEDPTILE